MSFCKHYLYTPVSIFRPLFHLLQIKISPKQSSIVKMTTIEIFHVVRPNGNGLIGNDYSMGIAVKKS